MKKNFEKNLLSLGLSLPKAPRPVASYLPLVRSGNLLFLSGVLPFVEGRLVSVGKIGDDLSIEDGSHAAGIALLNGLAAIKAEVGSLEEIQKVVRLAVYVSSTPEFTQQPIVANGASDLLVKIFGDTVGRHARLALGAVSLPLNACVELELIIEVAPDCSHLSAEKNGPRR